LKIMAFTTRRKIGVGVLIAASLFALMAPFVFKTSIPPTVAGATDTIAPSTTLGLAGTQGQHNWWVSSVTVTLKAHDDVALGSVHYKFDGGAETIALTPVVTDYSVSLSPIVSQGMHVLQYWAVDRAGNVEKAHTGSFQIDTSAPTVGFSMKDKYFEVDTLVINFSATDSQSQNSVLSAVLDGKTSVTDGQKISAGSLSNGNHILIVQVSDAAGNTVAVAKHFRVEKLAETIQGYIDGRKIDNLGVGNSLLVKADHALSKIDSGRTNAGVNQLNALENHLSAQSGHHIDPSAAQDLMSMTTAIMQSVSD
jgi:hypothetical protein